MLIFLWCISVVGQKADSTIVLIQCNCFICVTFMKWLISVLLLSKFSLPESSTVAADSMDVNAVVSHIFVSLYSFAVLFDIFGSSVFFLK